jgi:hypothetical protein
MAATDSDLGLVWSSSTSTAPYLHFLMTDFFSNRIQDARNNSATILSLIPSSSQYVSGKFIIEPVKFGRNPNAFNNVYEGGQYPDPGSTKARIYAYRPRTQFVRFILDGFLLRAAQKDVTRYVDPVVDLMADFMEDYMVDTARKLYSDGTGRLAEINEDAAALLADPTDDIGLRVNQDIATGQSAAGAAATGASDQPPTLYLEEGMRVAIFSPSGGAIRAYATIDAIVDGSTATFTTTDGTNWSATGVAVGDWIVKCSNDDQTSVSGAKVNSAFRTEPVGLGGILGEQGILDGNGPTKEVGSGTASPDSSLAYTWGGTDDVSVTNPNWFQGLPARPSASGWSSDMVFNQGIVAHAAGVKRTPSEQLIQRFVSTVRKTNNAKVNLFLSSYEVRDTYAESLIGEKRFTNTIDLKGGWDPALSGPAGIPWAVDRLCWHNRIYALALEDGGFMQHVLEPLSWASEEGSPVWTYLQDDDKYQARMVESYAIGVGIRNRCGGTLLDLLEA